MRSGVIYKVTSPSGKIYIGQTIQSFIKRRRDHERAAFDNKYHQYVSKFSAAIRKYNNNLLWEILENNISECNLNEREKHYIKLYDSFNNGYNGDLGGGGLGTPKSQECKEKIRKSHLGKKLSEQNKEKISESNFWKGKPGPMKGKHHSEESKRKISETIATRGNRWLGRFHTEETKTKMKEKWKERDSTNISKEKNPAAMRYYIKNPTRRRINF